MLSLSYNGKWNRNNRTLELLSTAVITSKDFSFIGIKHDVLSPWQRLITVISQFEIV